MAETTDVNEPSSTEAVRSEIRATEREMGETIHEIEKRLSPKRVAQRTQDSMRRAGVNVINRIKHNPIPLAMAGVGLWLFFRSSGEESEIEYGSSMDRVRSKASEVIGSTREKASELASTVSEKSDRVRGLAWQKLQGAGSQAQDLYERQPLVAALVALALGAVIGAIIPETEREDALLGETRDRLLDRAAEAARERVDRVKEVAREEGQRMKELAKEEGARIAQAAAGQE